MVTKEQLKRVVIVFLLGSAFSFSTQASSPEEEMDLDASSSATPAAAAARAEVQAMLEGLPRGDANSIQTLTRMAEAGDPGSQFLLGKTYVDRQNWQEARKWLEQSANQDNILALFYLGELYEDGYGVPKNAENTRRGISLQQRAADGGFDLAQYNMGKRYLLGTNVEQSFPKAYSYFQKAADQGFAPSQYSLGLMYGRGEVDGHPNDQQTLYWLQKAAAQGYSKAIETLARLIHSVAGAKEKTSEASKSGSASK